MNKQRKDNSKKTDETKTGSSTGSGSEEKYRGKAAKMDKAFSGKDKADTFIVKRQQPKKDSSSKRDNFDNARVSKIKKDIESDAEKQGANDVIWYAKNPELLKAAASIPFGSVLGMPISSTVAQRIPGINVLNWQPAYGSNEVAVNQSFNSQYSFVVHANSRDYRFDSADLGIIQIAGMDVFNIITTMMFAYGVFRYYESERNYYYPDAILRARGFILDDVRRNSAQMWFDLNDLINQTRQIWIPNTMPILDRWLWMNSNYFTDAEGTTSQSYVYNQDRFYIYDETDFKQGGAVVVVNENGEPTKELGTTAFHPSWDKQYPWSTWRNIAQSMINAILAAQDRGIMFGDVLNAYGAERIRAMGSVPSDLVLPPTYNKEVLIQFENATWSNAYIWGYGQTNNQIVTVWRNILVGDGVAQADTAVANFFDGSPTETVLNFHFPEQPTPEQIVVATRAKTVGLYTNLSGITFNFTNNELSTSSHVYQARSFCSELYHSCTMIKMTGYAAGSWSYQYYGLHANNYKNDPEENYTLADVLGNEMAFDWHPFIAVNTEVDRPVYAQSGTVTETAAQCYYGDFDNYTMLNLTNLDKLHTMAIFSLLGVPTVI